MGKLTDAYLVMYNSACLIGWGVALIRGVEAAVATQDLANVWPAVGDIVFLVQWAMCLEIFHALLGLVRSPVLVTTMQVTSRLWIVMVPFVDGPPTELGAALKIGSFTDCGISKEWCVGLMVLSWASVEVVRYTFYLCALLFSKVPYVVFWARYTAFALLYPTGITGELMTAWVGMKCFSSHPAGSVQQSVATVVAGIMIMYVPGSPFMYMNMVGNRKSAFKKRFAPPPKPLRGCQFPITDGKALRSTTTANKAVIAAAMKPCDAKAASACLREKKYRFQYAEHYLTLVKLGCFSPKNAVASAKAGLDWLYANFEFIDAQGKAAPFGDAVKKQSKGRVLASEIVRGTAVDETLKYVVPYDGGWHPKHAHPPKSVVSGAAELGELTQKWVAKGVVEQDAADAITWTCNYLESGGSLKNAHFVLIGAGSAMGPCAKLLELGANVVALDIPGSWGRGTKRPASGMWDRLIGLAEKSPGGSLTVPVTRGESGLLSERAGADLMNEPAEIAEWLETVWMPSLPKEAKIAVGNYTYLDGELHVKLALCADVIIQRVLAASKTLKFKTPAACAFLCTPTDAHVVPNKAATAAKVAYSKRGLLSSGPEWLIQKLTMGSKLRPNFSLKPIPTEDGAECNVCDGLSVAQGPNYALAKRMQHWRACVAFTEGHTASSMVAPSTATLSVIHNKTFAWAYGGMPHFGYEIFKQETTNAVMCAVLLHDVLNPNGPKNPNNAAKFGIKNPLWLFSTESVHGGLWRSPYAVDSLGEVAALLYFLAISKPALKVMVAVVMSVVFQSLHVGFLFAVLLLLVSPII